jgi:transcriptional regulator GlxA family with amidase domain
MAEVRAMTALLTGGLLFRGQTPCDTVTRYANDVPDMKQRSQPALFGVLIYEGVEPIDIGGTVGVVSMARRVLPHVEATVIARRAGPVRLAGGLTVQADHGIDTAPSCDVVIVCGGAGWPDAAADEAVLGYLRALPPKGVASVCTGAMILGASGVLNGIAATTRRHAVGIEAIAPLELLGQGGAIRTTVAQVVDAGVVTGGGVSLAIDATLYLLGRIYGEDCAAEVARVIEYDRAYVANREALGQVVTTNDR